MGSREEEQPETQGEAAADLERAIAVRERGDVDGAIRAFVAIAERHRGSSDERERRCVAEALINIGALCAKRGLREQSLGVYDRVLAEHADDAESVNHALYNKGIALGAMGRDPEALAGLSRYLDRYPARAQGMDTASLVGARMQRGIVHARLGHTDAALADLDAALDVVPAEREPLAGHLAQSMYNRAIVLRDAGRGAEALDAFGATVQAFARSSDDEARTFAAMAIYNRSLELARLKDSQGSIAAVEEMLERFGGERLPAIRERLAKAAYSRALLLYHGGNISGACVAFREIEASFVPKESPSIARVVAAARRHDLFTLACLNPALYAARGSGALEPTIQGALRIHGKEVGDKIPATVTVVHDLSGNGAALDGSALSRNEVEQLLSINPETLEALMSREQDPKNRDELSRLAEMRIGVVGQLELHNRASSLLVDYLRKGAPFGLYLRNFQPEGYWLTGHDPGQDAGPPPHRVRINVQLASRTAGETAMQVLPISALAVGNPAPLRPDFEYTIPRLLLPNEHWQSVVEELVRAAAIVVVEIDRLAPGVLAELAIIERVGKQEDTLIIISPADDLSGLAPLLAPYGAVMPDLPVARRDAPELAGFPHVVVVGESWPESIAPIARLSALPAEGIRWDGVAF